MGLVEDPLDDDDHGAGVFAHAADEVLAAAIRVVPDTRAAAKRHCAEPGGRQQPAVRRGAEGSVLGAIDQDTARYLRLALLKRHQPLKSRGPLDAGDVRAWGV